MAEGSASTTLDERERAELVSWSNDELRARRSACEAHEAAVSYARRVLQGRLDIVRAELERRLDAGDDDAEALLSRLPALLAGDHVATAPTRARVSSVTLPPEADALIARIDADLGEATLSGLADRSEDELTDLIAALERHEAELSSARRELFGSIDALRDELAARYKDGRTNVADLLA
ncbi:MAG: hypothetical protein WEB09_09510 [Nitriliruptor sp.]